MRLRARVLCEYRGCRCGPGRGPVRRAQSNHRGGLRGNAPGRNRRWRRHRGHRCRPEELLHVRRHRGGVQSTAMRKAAELCAGNGDRHLSHDTHLPGDSAAGAVEIHGGDGGAVMRAFPGSLRLRGRTRGQTATEFAMVAPLALTLLFAVIEFGLAIHAYSFASNSARDAVRYAIVHGGTSSSPASASDIQSLVYGEANGIDTNNLAVTTTWT